jgi:hypothetical protein
MERGPCDGLLKLHLETRGAGDRLLGKPYCSVRFCHSALTLTQLFPLPYSQPLKKVYAGSFPVFKKVKYQSQIFIFLPTMCLTIINAGIYSTEWLFINK